MKKLLLSSAFILILGIAQAQNQYTYDFNGTTADMLAAGWVRTNQSTLPSLTALWTVATYAPAVVTATSSGNPFQNSTYAVGATTPIPNGQAGGANSFAVVNYASTTSTAATGATISNWLISPVINVQNGDIVSFYTRLGQYPTALYADNLELRMSTNGAFTTNPSGGPTGVGDFTNLLVAINPSQNLTSYPVAWTQYSYTVAGLTGPTAVEFAFRYFVTDGGPAGANSDIIGIDSFSVDRPLSTSSFFASNFAVYPNPANSVLNITNKNNNLLNQVQLSDINGRIVKSMNVFKAPKTQINIGDLNSGVYLLKISSDQGVGTTKIIKE